MTSEVSPSCMSLMYMSSYVTGSPEIEVGKTMTWFVGKSVTMICRRM